MPLCIDIQIGGPRQTQENILSGLVAGTLDSQRMLKNLARPPVAREW